jgi:hypothetical protein
MTGSRGWLMSADDLWHWPSPGFVDIPEAWYAQEE